MKVFVLFPKASCYERKDTGTQRKLMEIFINYINKLVETNTTIIYLLEDKIAYDLIQKIGYANVECVTAIPQYDFQYLLRNEDSDDPIESYVYNLYPNTKCVAGDIGSEYDVDMKLMITDREQYDIKRKDCYKRRKRKILDCLTHRYNNVMLFRGNTNVDRCSDMTEDIKQGDGKLIMQVDINYGTIAVYYGGTYIPDNMLTSILSL